MSLPLVMQMMKVMPATIPLIAKRRMVAKSAKNHVWSQQHLSECQKSAHGSAMSNKKKAKSTKCVAMTASPENLQGLLNDAGWHKKELVLKMKKQDFIRRDDLHLQVIVNHIEKQQHQSKKPSDDCNSSDDENFPLLQETMNSHVSLEVLTLFVDAPASNQSNKSRSIKKSSVILKLKSICLH